MTVARRELDNVGSETLDGFLSWLHPKRILANKEYSTVYLKLVLFFEQHDCDPGVCAFETITRVARNVKDGICLDGSGSAIQNRMGFIFGVAKNVRFEYLRTARNPTVNLPPDPSPPESLVTRPAPDEHDEQESELVSETSRKLSFQMLSQCHREEWKLIRDYFAARRSPKQCEILAKQHGISINNLRVRVSRNRAFLKVEYDRYLKDLRQSIQS